MSSTADAAQPAAPAAPTARPSSPAKAKKLLDRADRTKEREFYRYYHHGGSRQPSRHGIAPSTPLPLPVQPSPRPADDTALTAFAQLGALRLDARRCLISFFDRKNCYILAEGTKTVSLESGQAEFQDDSICWGTAILPKEQSICYHTVSLPAQPDLAQSPFLVVDDLAADERFAKFPFVLGPPHSRFYAGVPIRSPAGHTIGTYCVLDDKPRNGISAFEMAFLQDMAGTVMRHLTMTRAADDHRRGGIMVRSLGSFAEGKIGPEEWWQDPWEADSVPSPETATAPRPRRSTVVGAPPPPAVNLHEAGVLDRNDSVNSSNPSVKSPEDISPSSCAPASAIITPVSEITTEHRSSEVATKTASSAKDDQKAKLAPEITAMFARAARMVVDATEAEGAVFFDAKISTFGGLVDVDEDLEQQPPESDKPCSLLGAALGQSTQEYLTASGSQYTMSESVLRHLLRTYSHGAIFNFDEDVTTLQVSPDGVEMDENEAFPFPASSRKAESSRSSDDENLLRDVFPKARSLVLYPLWDPHRDRYFASAIVWTTDPMRVFTSEQELSYLAAFSNSVMAEVARLDTKLADAAKADFISSVSHELRSPLHGILGTTDLLKHSSIDSQQASHVQTIEICGNTLLDTINHVLDFAKINNLTRGSSKRQKKRSHSARHTIKPGQGHTNDIMTLISDIDMSVITEEALESVFAGYNVQKSATEPSNTSTKEVQVPPIAVIVDVNKSDNYVFRTQPGAWRRVIMNLFGNALKYTNAGYIKVKLQVMPRITQGIKSTDDEFDFRLIITDSGIGMSEDYVNNRLFHSFAQENPLSQGTGLGLSIVKQIVESLGGDVEVRSEKGRGTKFTVSCPLKTSMSSPAITATGPEKEKQRYLQNIARRSTGMKVGFVGFDDDDEYFKVKSLKNKNATRLTLKALDNLFTEWFGMKALKQSVKDSNPDLIVATESGAKSLRAQYSQDPDSAPATPVIVICQGAASAQLSTSITIPGIVFECVAQPVGPHKLAKALSSCLDRYANRVMAHTTETDTTLSQVSQLNLKENAAPIRPESDTVVQEPARPPITSALSAPEVRSLSNSPVKKVTKSPHPALRCLAVDDNPINLRLLRTFIDKLGHQHVLATNGLEALETYKRASAPSASMTSSSPMLSPTTPLNAPSQRFDVVLMDINMPEMDGLEATRQIRAHEISNGLPRVTVIALTGVASTGAQQEAYSSGINLFLIKPVRLEHLETVLNGVITGQDNNNSNNNIDNANEAKGGQEPLRVDAENFQRNTSLAEGTKTTPKDDVHVDVLGDRKSSNELSHQRSRSLL